MLRLVLARVALAGAIAATVCSAASATTIDGAIFVSGGTTNYYDPTNGLVPAGYGNSVSPLAVPVGASVEFGAQDTGIVTITADFTLSTLSLALNNLEPFVNTFFPERQVFTASTVGFFGGLALANDTFPGGFSYGLVGDTLTVDWTGGDVSPGPIQAEFTFTGGAAPTPVPAALPLFATGLGVLSLFGWCRKRKTQAVA